MERLQNSEAERNQPILKKNKKKRNKKLQKLKKKKKINKKSRQGLQAEFVNALADEENRKQRALDYLHCFCFKKEEWKFKKKPQVWLFRNWHNQQLIDDKDFELLLSYIVGLPNESLSRKRLTEESELSFRDCQDKSQLNEKEFLRYERARQLLQCLS